MTRTSTSRPAASACAARLCREACRTGLAPGTDAAGTNGTEYYLLWTYAGTTYYAMAYVDPTGTQVFYNDGNTSDSSLTPPTSSNITGSFANGTLTMNVPLADVGNPADRLRTELSVRTDARRQRPGTRAVHRRYRWIAALVLRREDVQDDMSRTSPSCAPPKSRAHDGRTTNPGGAIRMLDHRHTGARDGSKLASICCNACWSGPTNGSAPGAAASMSKQLRSQSDRRRQVRAQDNLRVKGLHCANCLQIACRIDGVHPRAVDRVPEQLCGAQILRRYLA